MEDFVVNNDDTQDAIVIPNSAITISDGDGTPVLVIDTDGKMLWRPQGSTELVEMDVNKDVTLAFSLCCEMLSGLPAKTLMDTTRKKAVAEKAQSIAESVAQYLIDIKLTTEEHKDIHVKNVKSIIDGI